MEKKQKKTQHSNAKLSKIKCLRCGIEKIHHRNDAKFCSDLCRVQEMNERKENGYIKIAARGNWTDILSYFKAPDTPLNILLGGPFKWELEALNEMKRVLKESAVEKIQKRGMLLYYLPHLKNGQYELYVSLEVILKIKGQRTMNDPKSFLKKV